MVDPKVEIEMSSSPQLLRRIEVNISGRLIWEGESWGSTTYMGWAKCRSKDISLRKDPKERSRRTS